MLTLSEKAARVECIRRNMATNTVAWPVKRATYPAIVYHRVRSTSASRLLYTIMNHPQQQTCCKYDTARSIRSMSISALFFSFIPVAFIGSRSSACWYILIASLANPFESIHPAHKYNQVARENTHTNHGQSGKGWKGSHRKAHTSRATACCGLRRTRRCRKPNHMHLDLPTQQAGITARRNRVIGRPAWGREEKPHHIHDIRCMIEQPRVKQ